MIRDITEADIPATLAMGVDNEMFPPEGVGFIEDTIRAYLGGETEGRWRVKAEREAVIAVVFYEPREATDRVWYVQMLAVDPAHHGKGHGGALLTHVEDELRDAEQRLMLIETSGTEAYARTRSFYQRCGYTQVAQVPDYFEDGDDMVLFCKDLRRS